MRILFLTQVLPWPLDAGPKARAYYVLRYLLQHHDVTLVSFVRQTDTPAAIEHLRALCGDVRLVEIRRSTMLNLRFLVQSLFTSTPFLIQRDHSDEMKRVLEETMRSAAAQGRPFDAVHADQSWMAPYALYARQIANAAHKPVTVLDQHNAVYLITQRMGEQESNPLKRSLLTLEAHKMAHWEVETCRHFDHVTWVTPQDLAAVQEKANEIQPGLIIRNSGILPICGDPETVAPLQRTPDARRVTFLGGLHYPPNAHGILWYARHAFPRVLEKRPDAVLTVIGKQPPGELLALGIPAANLEVTGYVDDPTPLLQETAVFVVPLLAGGGMRVKIIDGWVWGLPIVSTTIGAEGIQLIDGENILLADTPESLADATVNLLQDRELRQRISAAGRAWVLEKYNWRTTYRGWDAVYTTGDTQTDRSGAADEDEERVNEGQSK